jgi:hypothetical protein
MTRDFIHIKKNALSKNTCDSLLELFEKNTKLQVEGLVGGFKDSKNNWKKDTEIALTPDFFSLESEWRDLLVDVMQSLSKEIEFYKKEYTFYTDNHEVAGLDGLSDWRVYPTFNFQRYLPGEGYYAWHCEAPNPKPRYVTRMLTWMIYLNDVPNAGTEFKFQNLKTDAEAGTIVIWPPYWTHMHRGIVSTDHNKYILTGWCNFLNETGEYFK